MARVMFFCGGSGAPRTMLDKSAKPHLSGYWGAQLGRSVALRAIGFDIVRGAPDPPTMNEYAGFGGRLPHDVPLWVNMSEAVFHIRIRCDHWNPTSLDDENLAPRILDSVLFYYAEEIWFPRLFLVMPDHLHALISFHPERRMSRVIGDWKRWHARKNDVHWQEGYFDHRLRSDESEEEAADYILRNPVVKGICDQPAEWPWRLAISPLDGRVTHGGS